MRELVRLDALFLCDDKTYIEIVNAWPEGLDINFSSAEDGTINYSIASTENNKTLFEAHLPLNTEIEDQPIQKPGFFKNQITQLLTTNEAIEMAGHVELLRRCDQGKFTTKIRLHFYDGDYDRELKNVTLENVSSENVYASVYQIKFDWNINCSFSELMPDDNLDSSRIYFFLDIELDSGEVISDRFGHNRIEGIYQNFASQAVWYESRLFAPYETKYKNLSVNTYSDAQRIKTTKIQFVKHDNGWYLDIQGAIKFDNYPSTKIEFILLDKNDREILSLPLEKSDDVKDGKFSGSFKLDDLDNKLKKGTYHFELRVAVANKTLSSKDFEISKGGKSSITRNKKKDILHKEEGNGTLLFKTRQRRPVWSRIRKKLKNWR